MRYTNGFPGCMALGSPGLTVPSVCACVWYFGTMGLRYPYVFKFYRYLAGGGGIRGTSLRSRIVGHLAYAVRML